jgi:hypothetical protein
VVQKGLPQSCHLVASVSRVVEPTLGQVAGANGTKVCAYETAVAACSENTPFNNGGRPRFFSATPVFLLRADEVIE